MIDNCCSPISNLKACECPPCNQNYKPELNSITIVKASFAKTEEFNRMNDGRDAYIILSDYMIKRYGVTEAVQRILKRKGITVKNSYFYNSTH